MTALRVTTRDDRSPLLVHSRGLDAAGSNRLAGAARRAGLSAMPGVGWCADHPARVARLFADADLVDAGWCPDVDAAAERSLEDAWTRMGARLDGGSVEAPGETAVRERGCRLFPYQEVGARWLCEAPGGGVLADSPGLGKTLQVLSALPVGAAVNVACPRNAVPTWDDEVARWRPDLRFRGLTKRRTATPAEPGEVVVGTLESLPDFEDLGSRGAPPGSYLVCDEAHSLKGMSEQARRFGGWSAAFRAARGQVWLLTGTPIVNCDPEELWRLLEACGRGRETLGDVDGLRSLFGHRVETVWLPPARRRFGRDTVERIIWTGEHPRWVDDALARAILRRTKEAVAPDMPAIIRRDLRVAVPASTLRDLMKGDVARRLEAELAAIERAVSAGAREQEIDRLAHQPTIATARRLLASAKVAAANAYIDELEAAGEASLLFSAHVEPVRRIAERPGWTVIDGDVSGERRGRIRREFQNGAWSSGLRSASDSGGWAAGVSLSIRAASESLTLTRAAYVTFLDQDWVAARNHQAECRAHRIGQCRSVTVTRLVADHPVDRRVAAAVAAKAAFHDVLLGQIENR